VSDTLQFVAGRGEGFVGSITPERVNTSSVTITPKRGEGFCITITTHFKVCRTERTRQSEKDRRVI